MEQGKVQNMVAKKPNKKLVYMHFISKHATHKTNGWERYRVRWLPLLHPDLHFQIHQVHLFFKLNVQSCTDVRK